MWRNTRVNQIVLLNRKTSREKYTYCKGLCSIVTRLIKEFICFIVEEEFDIKLHTLDKDKDKSVDLISKFLKHENELLR